MQHQFTHLVLSGGGLCGLAYIGALRFLQIEGFDKTIHHVAGSSIGALFATIFAARISLTDVERKLRTMLCDDGHLMEFAYPDMLSVLANLGVDDGHTFLAFLRPELDKLTFVDLVKRTGVHLVICATHVETMRTTYFSVDTTPNVLVYDALRASMAVPWMMRPVLIGEEHYIDGGISNNLPFSAFEGVNPSSVLMLNLVGFTGVANPLANPMAYTYAVLSTFVAPYNFVKLLMKTYPYVIMMDKCPIQFVPLSFGDQKIVVKSCKKDVEDTIVYGYETLYESLKSKLTPPGQT